jgi:hypothetical protein
VFAYQDATLVRNQAVRAAVGDGWTYRQIGAVLDLSVQRVAQIAKPHTERAERG